MLITLRDISLRFTHEPVLDEISMTIDDGERLCLVGRNGAGKSTLLKMIAGDVLPDSGEIEHADTLRVSQLPQDVPPGTAGTVYEVVTRGLGDLGRKLLRYEQAAHSGMDDEALLELQQQLEHAGAWQAKVRVDSVISRMGLDEEASFADLSGGLQRRVLLARALAVDPDILLLDEPTNHLDIAGVQWLEEFLLGANFSVVFISHDRAFVDRLATRIIEVDRGRLNHFPGRYAEYRQRKAEMLAAEKKANREFDKKLAEEEQWIRRGVKARTRRNMGRVRALEEMRDEVAGRRKYQKRASIQAQFGEASSRRVMEAKHLHASIAGQVLLKDFNLKIPRGTTIGVMGPNGCGKTSLLRVLLGDDPPDRGKLVHGENLQVAYFDQGRSQLHYDQTAAWNVADGSDRIDFDGKSLHIYGYLRAFLFDVQRAQTRVSELSGGERNRLLLARLFARPSNVLILDEPTNDLDVETLELLEDLVDNYPGTIILVSHDREFVNNVVDGMLIHEGYQGFRFYVGNYDDWLRQKREVSQPARKQETRPAPAAPRKPAKLSYHLQRELDALPEVIERLEADIAAMHEIMADPAFYEQNSELVVAEQQRLANLDAELAKAYARWEELEAQR